MFAFLIIFVFYVFGETGVWAKRGRTALRWALAVGGGAWIIRVALRPQGTPAGAWKEAAWLAVAIPVGTAVWFHLSRLDKVEAPSASPYGVPGAGVSGLAGDEEDEGRSASPSET